MEAVPSTSGLSGLSLLKDYVDSDDSESSEEEVKETSRSTFETFTHKISPSKELFPCSNKKPKISGGESSEEEVKETSSSTFETFTFKISPSKELFPSSNKKPKISGVERLPLPSLLNLSQDSQDTCTDDPELHGGRIRSFPHEVGNWATYVYIPYEMPASVEGFMTHCHHVMRCLAKVNIRPVQDFHITLTKTVVLRHHWIDLFVKSVQEYTKAIPRFHISFGAVKIYCNEERTRTFVGLEISEGLEELKESINVLDKCLAEFKLPPYYQDPSFHLSIGWVPGDAEKRMTSVLPQLDISLKQFIFANAHQWAFPVSQFFCKCAHKLFAFQLVN